ERFGAEFLKVITGEAPRTHPARRRLAGSAEGPLMDRLHSAQLVLSRGPEGRGKYLACNTTTLARIAETRPRTLEALERIPGMGPQKTERFGATFLEILAEENVA